MACAAAACDRVVYARGHCSRHYKQLLRHGEVLPDRAPRECAVQGCGRKAVTRGWCHGHYLRWSRTGDVQAEVPLQRGRRSCCSVVGCVRPVKSGGMCEAHRQRAKSTGDVRPELPLREPPSGSHLSHGYRRVTVPPAERWLVGGTTTAAEHRLVMARFLGRPLRPDESVHHRNGDRTDNRLENLELWARYQPTGARVVDLIAWARHVLARYEDDSDAATPGYST